MCLGLVPLDISVKFEGFMINHRDRTGKYRKKENGYHLQNVGQFDVIFHVHFSISSNNNNPVCMYLLVKGAC